MSAASDRRFDSAPGEPRLLEWLCGTQLTGIKLGLDNMHRLARELGLGAGAELTGARFLHVAGTNGKGSVCALLDAVLQAHGHRTGLYTSPHLVRFQERIRVDGLPISAEEIDDGLGRLRALTASWSDAPTFFEFTTALALEHFRRSGVEFVVWETGLGGRLDATNIVRPAVSILSPIAQDHEQFLGGTVAAIAAEKAGIIKAGVPVVSAPQSEEVGEVIQRQARLIGAPCEFVAGSWEGPLGLAGSHQRRNASLALAALRAAGIALDPTRTAAALAGARWPGRFDVRAAGQIVLDGAHNPAAARQLAVTWQEGFGAERATVIFASMRDKATRSVLAELAPIATRFITVAARNPRAESASVLRQLAEEFGPSEEAESLSVALRRTGLLPGRVLVCGSLFLVGEALALLEGGEAPRVSTQ